MGLCILGNDTEQLAIKSLGLKDNQIDAGTRNTIKMGNQNKHGLQAHLSQLAAPKIYSTSQLITNTGRSLKTCCEV